MEPFLDYLFLGNWTNIAVSCPQDLLDKNNNGSEMRKLAFTSFTSFYTLLRPIDRTQERGFFDFMNILLQQYEDSKMYFYYVGVIVLIIMLMLNRKRFIKSFALRLFTNYYFAFLLMNYFFVVFIFLFGQWIWIPLKDKYVWCVKKYPSYEIYYPTRNEQYLTVFDIYLRHISAVYKNSIKHILPAFLILHRITTYFACAHPFIFQRHFSNKRLKIYYLLIGLITYVLHFVAYNIAIKTEQKVTTIAEITVYSNYVNHITVLFVVIHIIMAIFSVCVVIMFQKSTKIELQEFKSFLGFSMGPVAMTIFEQALLITTSYAWTANYRSLEQLDYTWMMSIVSKFLYDIQPECLCVLYFLFVPCYRKILYRLFSCFKRSSKTKVHIVSVTNGSHHKQNILK